MTARRLPVLVATLALAGLLAACTANDPNAPHLGLGVGIGPNGLRLTPSLTTRVGGTTVGVTPGGASVGGNVGGVSVGASL
jgi:hypothetical protein